jgi:hypothetical protein
VGTRGSFGVIIGEKEKIGYNQFDSYPDGNGIENLKWLRTEWLQDDSLEEVRRLAEAAKVVSNETGRPTSAEQKDLAEYADANVSEQSLNDWYCLTRRTHGSIIAMLECGYIDDSSSFPLDSLFCEWAYLVDLDRNVFEVYKGFQRELPKKGRWAGRPTREEDEANYGLHLKWCAENNREPWLPEVSEYKAVELAASWPIDDLPTDEEFLETFEEEEEED